MDGPDDVSLKIATLQAIGYICETIKPEILSMRSNEILTAVIHGAREEEPSVDVQLPAINALYISLEFVRDNFKREGERNYIMQVVCEATQNLSVPVQVGAFECLVRIMSLYYDKMVFYMERALFELTVLGMKHPEESISLQAVEFWSTAAEYGEAPETESKNFAKIALPEIIPVLLGLLTRQDEDADEDEWNVSMVAATCLALLAQTVPEAIVPAAAVKTFGSIPDGPDPTVLTPLVTQALPILVDMTRDENLHVKDTVAWTLGRICDLLVVTLKPDEHLHPLISALVNALEDKPRIDANCCWAFMNLSDQLNSFYKEEGATSSSVPLSSYYKGIVTALLRVTDGTDNESNFRTFAYEALASYVTYAGPESITLLGIDDRNNWNELQSNLCSDLISVVYMLCNGIEPLADQIMTVLLGLTRSSKTSAVLEDAFLIAGTMAATLEVKLPPYIQAFLPFLYPALKAHQDTQLCTVAIGIIGDISRDWRAERAIPILSCFGDTALAIDSGFEPYLDHTMDVKLVDARKENEWRCREQREREHAAAANQLSSFYEEEGATLSSGLFALYL
ncbi:armadillo-type protein [Phellopilus nigrolimitatus]|nr:armadillo-type protein [Phellopilus nigrolimitatus]